MDFSDLTYEEMGVVLDNMTDEELIQCADRDCDGCGGRGLAEDEFGREYYCDCLDLEKLPERT